MRRKKVLNGRRTPIYDFEERGKKIILRKKKKSKKSSQDIVGTKKRGRRGRPLQSGGRGCLVSCTLVVAEEFEQGTHRTLLYKKK